MNSISSLNGQTAMREVTPTTADRFRWFWWLLNRSESFVVRLLGFSGMSVLRRSRVLVLETIGRRTGRRHRAVVVYWQRDGRYLIGGGAPAA